MVTEGDVSTTVSCGGECIDHHFTMATEDHPCLAHGIYIPDPTTQGDCVPQATSTKNTEGQEGDAAIRVDQGVHALTVSSKKCIGGEDGPQTI
ncbi:hypothetical protein L2E82_35354 [Cichorium intybus]|uniref:Uncharacterized protein n=1 Tax=Cichorium intybus TaxID=13427 RepID=A0ACB9BNN7_CICIN|nr:hypothetical protein L2E82_35354 [Cichorium intybus]